MGQEPGRVPQQWQAAAFPGQLLCKAQILPVISKGLFPGGGGEGSLGKYLTLSCE